MASLKFEKICKDFGKVKVLKEISFGIESGEFIVFVGPSGCGKSTLLRVIAGLEDITSGSLSFDDKVVNNLSPSQRGISMVFQSYALYPHMTVYQNMAFGMKLAKSSNENIDEKVRKAAEMLQLTEYLDRLPKNLSGGQRQRVAIGRAIVRDSEIFLFDEPLSNLDAALRVQTRIEIAQLHKTLGNRTMIYVTHDQVEAMTLADKVVVLRDGRVEQMGSPMEIYHKPANLFVAKFIGSPSMNVLNATGTIDNNTLSVRVSDESILDFKVGDNIGCDNIQLGIRPEDFIVIDEDNVEDSMFSGKVSYIENLGEVQLLYVDIKNQSEQAVVKLAGNIKIEQNQVIYLKAKKDDIHVFNNEKHVFFG